MTTETPEEKERQDRAFEIALSNLRHARQEAGEATIALTEAEIDRYRFFFNQGWSWGKEDRTYL